MKDSRNRRIQDKFYEIPEKAHTHTGSKVFGVVAFDKKLIRINIEHTNDNGSGNMELDDTFEVTWFEITIQVLLISG